VLITDAIRCAPQKNAREHRQVDAIGFLMKEEILRGYLDVSNAADETAAARIFASDGHGQRQLEIRRCTVAHVQTECAVLPSCVLVQDANR
jgi:hypothetical protein